MKLSDPVTFVALFMQKNSLTITFNFDTFFNSVHLTTLHKVQQINLNTCIELEQTMQCLTFTFKDQRYKLSWERKSTPFLVKLEKKNALQCQY